MTNTMEHSETNQCTLSTNALISLLKEAALYFDKLTILDPVGASWDTVSTDYVANEEA